MILSTQPSYRVTWGIRARSSQYRTQYTLPQYTMHFAHALFRALQSTAQHSKHKYWSSPFIESGHRCTPQVIHSLSVHSQARQVSGNVTQHIF